MKPELTAWLRSYDTGRSSLTIVGVMEPSQNWLNTGHHPLDPADLGRCIQLLNIMPEWKPLLNRMSGVSEEWSVLIEHWDELVALYFEEEQTGRAPKCYDRMTELLDPIRQRQYAARRALIESRQKDRSPKPGE